MKFAEIVVNIRLRRRAESGIITGNSEAKSKSRGDTFHYSIPQTLKKQISVGHLVVVPFGPARLYGIVVALVATAPVEQVKEIEALALPRPVVTPTQIVLARWMRDEYQSTLGHCLYTMLPPGLARPARITYTLTDPDKELPTNLTGTARAVAALLAREGTLRRTQIHHRLKLTRETLRRTLRKLLRRGLLVAKSELPPPGGKVRRARFVRLLVDAAAIAAARPHLGHDSAQARVLRWLADGGEPLPTLSQVCKAAGCSRAPVQALVKKGWVALTPRQITLLPILAPDKLAHLAEQKARRAPRQAELLRYLARHPGPVAWDTVRDNTGISDSIIRALEKVGAIRLTVQEPAVLLRLTPEDTRDRALELRGGKVQAAVLDLLRREGKQLWVSWLYAETGCSRRDLYRLAELGLIELAGTETWPHKQTDQIAAETPPPLTGDQAAAWAEIEPALSNQSPTQPNAFLLHGVTGSGKTEIYLRALAKILAQKRQAIVLVPEISLTPQTVQRFTTRFPGRAAAYHSALSAGERQDIWRRARDGHIDIIIGPRSALFLPLPRPGLIVLDEEHSTSYKQQHAPCYHARDVALKLSTLTGATFILGSATPDLISYHRAKQGHYRLLKLSRRILANAPGPQFTSLPLAQVVDLRDELRAGNRSIFSRALHRALAETLNLGQQAILFLNRRGAATFINCRNCGHVLQCSRCDLPLTYHSSDDKLLCHHCNRQSTPPDACPQCGNQHIRYFGIGTQRVEAAVQKHFAGARVLRWDRDTAGTRWAHEKFLQTFANHQADVLVGTQMVSKGLDLPLVTLVGVIAADTTLHLPDYRAAERTFQLLTQVAGRAGRSVSGGKVIIQTYSPESYAVQLAARHDYEGFYKKEIAFRHHTGYPPFYRLARLVYADADYARCQAQAETMRQTLEELIARLGLPEISMIGPAPCFITRKRGRYRWQIIIRAPQPQELLRYVTLPPGWQADIDPANLI